ncbi:MAG: DNA polymerase, partial [Erysipelotrichaceae bacterium]
IYGKKGKPKLPIDEERIEYTYSYLKGYKRIFKELYNNLEKKEMLPLLFDIEMPLTKVLYEMEENGVCVDANILASIAKDCEFKINNLEKEIYDLVGHSFNINSPKQLAEVLFDELNIPTTKKRSTSIDILNKNIDIHPIFKLVIEHRKYYKLYSTYAIGLSKHIQKDNKIHTIYKQCYTQTGRLSSVEPNLQNISVRNEEGREIRKAFKASPGCVLLGSDYSQIELRILAHMANEDKMQEAFNSYEDIHTLTASNIFNVSIEEVSNVMRRQAKAINFGIVYGMSVFGLSEQLNISNYDAKEFIDKYNETYPNIEKFMNETVEFCEKNGYVKTMFNRRRDIKEINEKGFMKKEFGKRAAMNAPIQGTAADLIKVAMVKVNEEIHKRNLKSKMILQIHDELIFDVDKSEIELMKEIVKDSMENAMVLKVPLVASQSIADTWYDCK